jgi:hypothetical protein
MWVFGVFLGLVFFFGGFYWAVGLAVLGHLFAGPWAAIAGWIVGFYLDEKAGRIK